MPPADPATPLAAPAANTTHERCDTCRQPTCRCEPNTSLTALAAAVGVLRPSSLATLLRHLPTSYPQATSRVAEVS
ncbi:hypothetical protein [Streptomyces scopuliridis]|uniref:Uncharacterized protein n=1 Tax=Streptomyces scopuliridis TaxID=452529 RepID=A0ACD4ZNR1_9ACTN|nr:hypothetical protein [Streptomyces scopuliridis]WSC00086.1 hypothetical protein OG835_25875 [Streptomyces scopuliridis]